MFRDESGLSTVLAVVLMMGFVAAASVTLFVIATSTITSSQNAAEEAQVEDTFEQFDKDVESVAFGRDKYRSMTFEVQNERAAFRKKDTGTIKVFVDGTKEVDESVGSLVYERDDSTIAYQAGGVWSGTGNDTRMVAEPPVEYQNGSLTFPILKLEGVDNLEAGTLAIEKNETVSQLNDDGYTKGNLVTIEITSKYYVGWAEYFRTHTTDVAVSVDHSPSGPRGTVTVKLGKPVANGDFDDGVLATGGEDGDVSFDGGSAEIDGDVSATGDIDDTDGTITGDQNESLDARLFQLDEAIDRKLEEVEDDGSVTEIDPESGGASLTGGNTYLDTDGFDLDDSGDTIDVDLSAGNVTLVVDGDIELTKGDIDVDDGGTDHALRIYATGDFGMKNADAGNTDDDTAEHLQIYGTSEMLVGLSGGSTHFVGTIYAPRDDPALGASEANTAMVDGTSDCDGWDVCIVDGSSAVKGAILAGPTKLANGSQITHDGTLDTIDPTMELDGGVLPPELTFVKVSLHRVDVNNTDQPKIARVGGIGPPTTAPHPSASLNGDAPDAAGPTPRLGVATRTPQPDA